MYRIEPLLELKKEAKRDLIELKYQGFLTAKRTGESYVEELNTKVKCVHFLADILEKHEAVKKTSKSLNQTVSYVDSRGYRYNDYEKDIIVKLKIIELEDAIKGIKEYIKYKNIFDSFATDREAKKKLLRTVFNSNKEIRDKILSRYFSEDNLI